MMWVFGLSIGVTIVTIAVTPFLTLTDNKLIPLMLEIIKIAVVPMTALVIGYYLPKSGR